MKLVVAVVQDYDVDRLLRAVTEAGLRATRVASTGGFLRTGNTTVLLGVPDERVGQCLGLLSTACGARLEPAGERLAPNLEEIYGPGLAEVAVGGGVAFVAPVRRFERYP
jgi:uncharacterized protein YaaQ